MPGTKVRNERLQGKRSRRTEDREREDDGGDENREKRSYHLEEKSEHLYGGQDNFEQACVHPDSRHVQRTYLKLTGVRTASL